MDRTGRCLVESREADQDTLLCSWHCRSDNIPSLRFDPTHYNTVIVLHEILQSVFNLIVCTSHCRDATVQCVVSG